MTFDTFHDEMCSVGWFMGSPVRVPEHLYRESRRPGKEVRVRLSVRCRVGQGQFKGKHETGGWRVEDVELSVHERGKFPAD